MCCVRCASVVAVRRCWSVALARRLRFDAEGRDRAAWTPEKLYAEAKEEAAIGNYERAAKLYERLEGRAAGTAAGAAGADRTCLRAVQDQRQGPGAVDARAFHQAAPDQPGARLRAVPAGPGQLQRQPRPARQPVAPGSVGARPAGRARFLPVVQAARRAVPAVDLRRRCARCA